MSDLNEWLKERRTIHNAATEGPWEVERHAPEDSDYQSFGVGAGDVYVVFELPWDATGAGKLDAEAIVDGHNSLPDLLTAVENVLELHRPEYLIRDGEWIPASCAVCEPWTWPCATVRAIEGANQ